MRQEEKYQRVAFWIDKELKKKADETIYLLGLKPSIVISLLYQQIVTHRELPFYIKLKDDENL